MIYIQRNRVEKPGILSSTEVLNDIDTIHKDVMSGTRVSFFKTGRVFKECRAPLEELFRRKCAYCEVRINESQPEIDTFRPKTKALNSDGKIGPGYYWLAYDWNNLYHTCQLCNRYKGTRFPVNGKRLQFPEMDTSTEKAMLLDPCNQSDWKESHFRFESSGELNPVTEKGKITIEVLGLNRESLVIDRARTVLNLKSVFNKAGRIFSGDKVREALEEITRELDPGEPNLALRRVYVEDWISKRRLKLKKNFPDLIEKIDSLLMGDSSPLFDDVQDWAKGMKIKGESKESMSQQSFKEQTSYDLKSTQSLHKRAYFMGAKLIERIEIVNFKGIKRLYLEYPKPELSSEGESWMILIGRNSTGKSTLLQAVALALIGQETLNKVNEVFDASKFVRRATGVRKGHVKVWITNFSEPLKLEFDLSSPEFRSNIDSEVVMILAYGSTRILPIRQNDVETQFEYRPVNIRNLFDPQNQLRDVEKWLGDTNAVNSKQFELVTQAMLQLLDLDITEREKVEIYRRKGKVKVRLADGKYSIRELCDGYQSVIAFSLDIMMTLLEKWGAIEHAEGIVLIDEIGVHLHPSWKIKIISLLRSVFKRTTFIVTTHDPLCLRGAHKGEIHVLSRNHLTNEIVAEQVDIPPGTPVEKLYTGMWFALDGTLDPDTSELMANHRKLVFEGKPENTEEIKAIELELENRLKVQPDGSLYGEFREVLNEVLEENIAEMDEDDFKSQLKAKLKSKYSK